MKKTVTLLMRVMFIYGVGADTASRMWNQYKLTDQRLSYGPPWNFPTPIFSLNQLRGHIPLGCKPTWWVTPPKGGE